MLFDCVWEAGGFGGGADLGATAGGWVDFSAGLGAAAGGWVDFAAGLVWGGGAGAGTGSWSVVGVADSEVGSDSSTANPGVDEGVGAFSSAASLAFGNSISLPQPSMGQAYCPDSCVLI